MERYIILYEHTAEELMEIVNKCMEQGYKPQGGAYVGRAYNPVMRQCDENYTGDIVWIQAMVLELNN